MKKCSHSPRQAVDESLQFPFFEGEIAESVAEAHAAFCAAPAAGAATAEWQLVRTLDFAIARAREDGAFGFFKKIQYAWMLEPFVERYTRAAKSVSAWSAEHSAHDHDAEPDAARMVALAEMLLRFSRLPFFGGAEHVAAARLYAREAKYIVMRAEAPCDTWTYVRAELVQARACVLQGDSPAASAILRALMDCVLDAEQPWQGFTSVGTKQRKEIASACRPLLVALNDEPLAERCLDWLIDAHAACA